MATRNEKRQWRKEFETQGIRWVREQEAHSIGSPEKLQCARRWLRRQEMLPYALGASIGAVASIAGTIVGALLTAFLGGTR
jgi:hypothetical protein